MGYKIKSFFFFVYKLQLSLVEKYTIQRVLLSFFFLVINVISLINKLNTIFINVSAAAAAGGDETLRTWFPRRSRTASVDTAGNSPLDAQLFVFLFYVILLLSGNFSGNLQHLLLSDIHVKVG